MTRVVVVDLSCNSPYYCGPLASALLDAGAEVELASPRFYLEPDFLDPYPVAGWMVNLVVHASRRRPLRLLLRTVELAVNATRLGVRIRSGRYDVVHVQWVPFDDRTTLLMRALRRVCDASRTVLVLTSHNVMPHDRVGADPGTVRRNLDLADLVIAHTQHVERALVAELGTRSPIALVPHGPLFVDRPLPAPNAALSRLGLDPAPTVLFLGLIRSYKGLDLLGTAWPDVRRSHPTARLLVVGSVHDEAARRDSEHLRTLAGVVVDDRYVSVATMLDYYAVSDVVVFPYHRISQSGALMTAAGLGRPTVVTPAPGLLEQVGLLTSSLVADDISGASVARALDEALSGSAALRAAAERDRAALIESGSGWRAIARATLQAYASESGRARA